MLDEELNEIYQFFDVFALPTMGEGFGLPILEAMSCSVPVIATDCSAVTELVQGRGELIRVKEWLTVGPYNIEQAIADTDHFVELLNKLYENPDLRAEYGRKGRAFAETMTWDKCAQQWAELIEEVGDEWPKGRSFSWSGPPWLPAVSVVVSFPDRAAWAAWVAGQGQERVQEWLDKQGSGFVEWIALVGDEDMELFSEVRASLGAAVVVMRLPAETAPKERLRAAVRVSRARRVWVVAPDGGLDEEHEGTIQMEGKEVRW